MKRLILRISALGGVIALGLIGIAQARRGSEESTTPVGETPVAEATSLPSSEPPAVAVVVQPTSTVRTETVDARSAWPTDPRQPGLFPGAPQARPLGGDTYSLALDERGPVVQPAVLETSDPGRYAASALPGPELAAADASFADYAGATDQPNPLRPVAATDPDTTPPATPFPTDPYPTTSEVGAPSNTAYPTTSEVGAPGQFAGSTPAGASSLPPIPTGSSPPSYPVTASDYPAASAGASAMPTSPAPLQVAPLAPIGQPVTPVAPRTLQPITASPIANSTASGATTPGSFGPTSRMGRPSLIGQPSAALPHPSSGFAASPSDSFTASGGNDASQGTALPGDRKTEGPQSPRVTIEKSAPNEIQVGKPATFTITVRNGGEFPAAQVEIRDRIPKGTRLLGTTPRASQGDQGELVWVLGTLKPAEETTVEVELMPIAEGEIGSVATVHFAADASVRTVATKPVLTVDVAAPATVLIGEEAAVTLTITNTGTGTATGVLLEASIPPQLQHASGGELDCTIGDLPPGESRKIELRLTATQAGTAIGRFAARGDANLIAEGQSTTEIVAPQLDVAVEGPRRRYLERQASYVLSVANPGTAPARQVKLVAHLPRGLKFVEANNAGYYEESSRSVYWLLQELPPKETGNVTLTAMPIEAGEQLLRCSASAEKGLAAEKQHTVSIEGIAAIMFTVADLEDPIEINGETTYEISVLNQGSKTATNVQLAVTLPAAMRAVAAEGPSQYSISGNQVLFAGLPRLAPKADTTYRVRVQGLQSGDQRVRVELLTDEMKSGTPVVKEESTQVYSDE